MAITEKVEHETTPSLMTSSASSDPVAVAVAEERSGDIESCWQGGSSGWGRGALELTIEQDTQAYERHIHQVMSRFPEICESRKKEFYQVFTLITAKDNARERRRRCFNYFSTHMSEGNNFEAGLVYEVSHELLVLVDEFRELLDRLFSWCDLCLPAQEQAFAESHRLKIQKFQVQIVSEMKRSNTTRSHVQQHMTQRVDTLRKLLSTKDVLEKDRGGWTTVHCDLLKLQESNAYLSMARSWEQILESYLLLFNYWRVNLQDSRMVLNDGKSRNSNDYFA